MITDKTKVRKRGRNKKRPSKETFEYHYYELQMPTEEMAKLYGVNKHTIYNWASQFNKGVL